MSDFLQNLRNNAKRQERNRRGYDNHNYQNQDRRQRDSRNGNTQRKGNYGGDPNLIKKALEEMTEAQKRVVATNQELISLEKRKVSAIEEIAALLQNILPGQAPAIPLQAVAQAVSETPAEPVAAVKETSPKHDRSSIVRKIQKLRKEKMSYDKIASYLTTNGVPTLSGRGQWRGQTILRLSKETP